MKRFALFITAVMLAAALFIPLSACSDEGAINHEYLIFETTDGGVKVTGFNEQTLPEDVVIPEKIGGKAVSEIARLAFYDCKTIKSVHIPDSVKTIGKNAFYGCTKLESVTLPGGLTRISEYCFYSCSSLKNITFPDSVEEIAEYAFYGCPKIGATKMPASLKTIKDYAFYACLNLQTAIPDGVTVDNYAFITRSESTQFKTLNSFTFTDKITPRFYSFGESTAYISFASDPKEWNFPKHSLKKHLWSNNNYSFGSSSFFHHCKMGYDGNIPYVQSVDIDRIDINGGIDYSVYATSNQQPPYRSGYRFGGWSITKDSPKADFTIILFDETLSSNGVEIRDFYGTDKSTDKKITIPLGTTLYAVWQELDENGSVLLPV